MGLQTKNAAHFRSTFGLGKEDPINFRDLLYKIDVLTIFRPLSDGFSGMAQITNGHRFMLINTEHPLGRQNFTICHELYHLFYQEDFTAMICNTGKFEKRDKEEYKADFFAAELLLPEFGILQMIPPGELNNISLGTLLRIEHKFGCSRSALLYRLKYMNLIDATYFETYSKNVIRGAAQHGYTAHLYSPTRQSLEVVGDYGDRARSKYDAGIISESHYISLMQDIGIDLDETIDDYVGQY